MKIEILQIFAMISDALDDEEKNMCTECEACEEIKIILKMFVKENIIESKRDVTKTRHPLRDDDTEEKKLVEVKSLKKVANFKLIQEDEKKWQERWLLK